MSSHSCEYMTWHTKCVEDETMTHPAHGEAWVHFDTTHPQFSSEPRNIPGKNLDIFLRPLIDELKTLWTKGIQTYDACKKENFQMRATLLWTITDFPANAMVLGWSTHGLMACPYCMEFTKSFSLQNDYWSKEKFQRLSKAGKKNRPTPNDGSISTHTGGSKPIAAYKEDMQREYNREVSDIELYDRTHRGNKGRVYGFGSQPLHRSFGDIARGSGFKTKHKEAAKNAQEDSNERFDRLQDEMEKLKQTNMQLQGQHRVILKATEQCLPDTICQML
ncbi:UNVERIFIED_CONTAM: hypothetical protein Slati_3050700 [Sesamum latifolium]|uniref:Transposase n=1 Tax=Sesamum latifolium TaxID=2727402 RepID=A0AAW2UTG9_9LAMI